ncbi:MAG: TIGR03936 family radical SAM-associated protein [Spirochaetaceae bacterium]|jgi:radical SAM superfamily enzyme YgiQ (UPF0313 family)|nr:TIGR03936 family radical SAM-associated protein [Spirochaetaceae bacterium]
MEILYVDPLENLGGLLLEVEKPGRYTGGEYGCLARRLPGGSDGNALQTLIAFPDLYEIGMSNQAFRIIYNRLNKIPGIICDRAFAPAPDFEKLLRARSLPLYGLDTGISLKGLDILMFTLGYELGITGVLTMLDVSSIPVFSAERGGEDPIVIMGGPCVSNPLPYAAFIDAFWIGEAEAGFFDLAEELLGMKRAGAGREDILRRIRSHPSVWTRGKDRAVRAIDAGFTHRPPDAAVFPVPSMKTVQHHGAVEIMRGCPNGCRFCHAGFWYRPMRQKPGDTVLKEAEAFISRGGYREISLSSLSSGDYAYIDDLADQLNRKFADRHISFQLPSLKVSSFSLPLLEKISETRKSGLTFAVETPEEGWQLAINKTVGRDNVLAILREAKKRGWRGAKFYFMVGLPVGDPSALVEGADSEESRIVDFIAGIGRETGMHFNINVGIFVPKPHTPFQRVPQINMAEARRKLDHIRSRLKPLGHKVSVQDPLTSVIEGLLSRGDERMGRLVKEAFDRGCRLDAWTDFFNKAVWEEILAAHKDLEEDIRGEKEIDKPLAWSMIDPGVSQGTFTSEFARAQNEEFTSPCMEKCTHSCGICHENRKIVKNIIHGDNLHQDNSTDNPLVQEQPRPDPSLWRVIFSFTKEGRAVFLSHLGVMEVFSMALVRSEIPVLYTTGFNPLPKLEICAPLSMGIYAGGEIAAIDTRDYYGAGLFTQRMNGNLPDGIRIQEAHNYFIPGGEKKYSLSSRLWGFTYAGERGAVDYVKFREEKNYRTLRIGSGGGSFFGLRRLSVLALDPENPEQGLPYFTAFRLLYPRDNPVP